MAKSTDCCVTDGCFCVAAKGLNLCLGCWDDMSVSFLGDVCQVSKCLNVPDEGETVCSACWTIHENANLPGFPSEYEGSLSGDVLCDGCGKEECHCSFVDLVESDWAEEQLGGCGTCNAPTNDWFCKSCYKTQDVICNRIAQEEELTQCTDSCKEMGMMSEGCEFCE